MLKSCQYCGRIHDSKQICRQKQEAKERRWKQRNETDVVKFRRSAAWKKKSIQIRKRDEYLCLCCLAGLPGTIKKYNTEDLSVHHITPVEEDQGRRLDEDNLITVCAVHHEMCEAGEISRVIQHSLIEKNKENSCPEIM